MPDAVGAFAVHAHRIIPTTRGDESIRPPIAAQYRLIVPTLESHAKRELSVTKSRPIPHHEFAVAATAHASSARATIHSTSRLKARAPHRPSMPFTPITTLSTQYLRARPIIPVLVFAPHANAFIVARAHEHILARVPRHALHIPSVPMQRCDALELFFPVRFPHPHRSVAPARGEQRTARGPRAALHLGFVTLERARPPPRVLRRRPHVHRARAVKRCAGEHSPARRDGDAAHRAIVRALKHRRWAPR
mmetsp:Transcript_3395/g.12231  ORF Transcript_3395/g.12231 Transcript_3395/m.12231 type:complete len:249 (+) Transcript_3395:179-925(+)